MSNVPGGCSHVLDDTGVLRLVMAEYDRARQTHGENTLDGAHASDLTRLAALVEEVGEVAELLTYDKSALAAGDESITKWRAALKKELIQIANVSLTWASIL